MKQRLGCLSTSALGAAALTVVAIGVVLLLGGGRAFSPGPLQAQAGEAAVGGIWSHAETGGHCAACHPAPWGDERMADRCLACHEEINRELDDPASLHGTFGASEPGLDCRPCHTEHGGPDAELTRLDPATFPHHVTGYALDGHQATADGRPFGCVDCHDGDLTHFEEAACDDCHRQIDGAYMQAHTAAFGRGCLACHDGVDRYGDRFDHGQTAFALTGAHAAADCAGCHANARTVADLQAAPGTCYDCHRDDDEHDGQFGQDCAACHTADDWAQATFDHSLTDFPLTGRHDGLDCRDCHAGNVYEGTPQACYDCHRDDDEHEGQFGQDCAACHAAEGWEQVTFDHSKTSFPLDGKHAGVECERCHEANTFEGTPSTCAACHDDPAYHLGLFGTECQDCHTAVGWSPARFDRPHEFPIDHGESGASPCATCHPDSLTTYTCYGCHEHNEAEIAGKHREEGIADFADCMRCHPTGQKEEGEGEGHDN